MTSNSTSDSVAGSPGPSVRVEETEYETMRNSKERFSSLSSSEMKEMERLRRELEDSRQRIDRDTEVINNLHEKVTELEELVKKQKITISTQSRTISDRRVLRKNQQQHQQQQHQSPMGVFPMTPTHHSHVKQYQFPNSGASAVSCAGNVGGAPGGGVYLAHQSPSPFDIQTPQSVHSVRPASQGSTVFDQPPPKFEISSGLSAPAPTSFVPPALAQSVLNPMAIALSNSSDPGTSFCPHPVDTYRKELADFSTRFSGLMRSVEIFGQAHASLPNIFMDSHLDDRVKDYLMAISSRSQASALIGNAATRGFFVAKAISYYLVHNVLTTSAIKGFDISVDLEIDQIEEQMTAHSSASMRHLMLTAITTHLTTLSKRPNFAELSQLKIKNHMHRLWKFIGPLSHDPSNQTGQVYADLTHIITDAQSLAIDMYSVPLEYRFDYPEPGEPFDSLTMINRDPYLHGDPLTLKNGDTHVRLGISPTVRIRNNAQSPGVVNLMYLGHVLLKMPKKQNS
ncbi:hypothetical protein ASPCAL09146 [Aspergillus calidoustus]|uniref:Uncharacterized protein n=1 Tax=Aspergillus calidoustus TaxID=454130 RepID=A0A0U5CRG8_ASPCI|nr:hypothetical protein ASPCAL09146 [Aspergillus calidoustus]